MPTSFQEIPFVNLLKTRNSKFLSKIKEVYERASKHLSTRIPSIFPEFTLHDIEHSIRILKHIEKLIENVDELNDFEIVLIIYSAFLHDIGMGPDEEILEDLKNGDLMFSNIKFRALKNKFKGNDKEAVKYLVRKFHAEISSILIKKHYKDLLVFPEMSHISFVDEVCQLCESHTKEFSWIKSRLSEETLKADFTFNLQYISSLLRLGDILDIDGNRTPVILYNLIQPTGYSQKEWQKHYLITNEQKVRVDKQTEEKAIYLYGECKNVEIHRKLLEYIGFINNEIDNALSQSRNFQEKHRFYLRSRVVNKIKPKGYTLSSLKLEIDFKAISNLLMGEKIYGEKKLGLREIIQNSIDACKVRKEIEDEKRQIEDEPYIGKIKLVLDPANNRVSIIDNGTGMTDYMIRNYFLSIGKSYYKSDDYLLQDLNYRPIGNFGIGFLSCFMLSDNASIFTRNVSENKAYRIDIKKDSEYVSYTESEESEFIGTKIEIEHDDFCDCFEGAEDLKEFIKTYFILNSIQFEFIDKKSDTKEIISNDLEDLEIDSYALDLSTYLNDIEGIAQIKTIPKLINNISSLYEYLRIREEDSYIIDSNKKIVKNTDEYSIKNLINDGKIFYLKFGLYDHLDYEDFQKLLGIIEDFDEVLEKKDPSKFGYLFLDSKFQKPFVSDSEATVWYDLYSDFEIDFLEDHKIDVNKFIKEKFGDYNCLFVSSNTINIFSEDNSNYMIPYSIGSISSRYFYESPFITKGKKGHYSFRNRLQFYLRNVLIEDFKSSEVVKWDLLDFEKITINAFHKDLIPNISRKDFDSLTTELLSQAISYSLHMKIVDLEILSTNENELIAEFSNTFFSKTNPFIK